MRATSHRWQVCEAVGEQNMAVVRQGEKGREGGRMAEAGVRQGRKARRCV